MRRVGRPAQSSGIAVTPTPTIESAPPGGRPGRGRKFTLQLWRSSSSSRLPDITKAASWRSTGYTPGPRGAAARGRSARPGLRSELGEAEPGDAPPSSSGSQLLGAGGMADRGPPAIRRRRALAAVAGQVGAVGDAEGWPRRQPAGPAGGAWRRRVGHRAQGRCALMRPPSAWRFSGS